MSGRWEETDAVWTSITILDAALSNQSQQSVWVNRPTSLNQLDRINSDLDQLEAAISASIDELNETGEITPAELEGLLVDAETDLARLGSKAQKNTEQISILSGQLDSLLGELDQKIDQRRILLAQIQTNLPNTIQILTPNGEKTLNYNAGRYRYSNYVDDYEGVYGENLNWLHDITKAYGTEEKRVSTTTVKRSSSDQYAKSRGLISKRRKQADAAALQISTEHLRRSRDAEIMAIAEIQGYKIQRRAKGKKVNYVLVRYK
ncbi:hypothetical protein N9A87_03490 [Euryarchaeota archaeon]|nr:hypothetical protein [Euryarchaeota archaeon]